MPFVFVFLFCSFGFADKARKPSQIFNLECGTYKAVGRFGLNTKQQFILSLNRASFSPAELLVIGGDIEKKVRSLNKIVILEFYVPSPIDGTSGNNVVFLRSISTTQASEATSSPELIQSEKCGLNEKFSD